MEEFTSWNIMKMLNIQHERFREWLKFGYIRPSIQPAKGTGTKALFNRTDVYVVGAFKQLIENGYSRVHAATCASQIYQKGASSAKYAIFRFIYYRNLEWVNVGIRKDDSKKKDVGHLDVKFATNHVDVQNHFSEDAFWDQLIVLNLEKLRREIDEIIG